MNDDNRARFRCRTCGIELTEDLTLLTDTSLLCREDRRAHVPRGFYFVAPPPDEPGGYYKDAAGHCLVNLADARNTRRHPDPRRRRGCCGLDGCDGRNTLCANGHEVGTERSDCWMAHSLALDPECVEPVTGDSSSASTT